MRRPHRARGDDADQFDGFVAATADPLLRTAYLLAWDMAEAEDLVQECLFRVARRWPRVQRMEHPAAYARRILVNLSLDGAKGRARRRQELAVSPAASEGADHRAARALRNVDANQALLDALRQLPRRQRAAIVLRYFEDMSEAQTAEALGCSLGTVKSTTSKALDRLRRTVPNDDIDPTNPDDGSSARWPSPERSTTP
jgi:RNA polymerase sigma-70 factor (sigma-E family)